MQAYKTLLLTKYGSKGLTKENTQEYVKGTLLKVREGESYHGLQAY
jgi:hypothetical protein